MASTDFAAIRLTPSEHEVRLRRAIVAFTIGTAIEWYDFFLYSTVTGLVVAKLFFPSSDPLVGTLEALAIYAVGFIARPLEAAIFGHYGDRIGRKSTLISSKALVWGASGGGSVLLSMEWASLESFHAGLSPLICNRHLYRDLRRGLIATALMADYKDL